MGDLTRREFVRSSVGGTLAATLTGCGGGGSKSGRKAERDDAPPADECVNDVHSRLNRTHVAGVDRPTSREELVRLIGSAHRRGASVAVCGARHAGGGQQFRSDRRLIDLSQMNRVLAFDPAAGTIEVEAGIRWPALLDDLHARQPPSPDTPEAAWGIRQKQGGSDELSLGGAVASNVHGRCLASRPFVQDVVSLQLVTPAGDVVTCDRDHDADLPPHVVGGYGLFGVVYSLTLRLTRRRKLVRRVQWVRAADAVATLESKRDAGAWHGDFQFSVVERDPDFCTAGLCSWYEPVPDDTPVSTPSREARVEQFNQLVGLAHRDKAAGWDAYRKVTLSRDGTSVDWSDDWQRADYVADYHRAIDAASGAAAGEGSEILSELYVPRDVLAKFLGASAAILRRSGANLIYGTVRLIQRDDETVLAWAKRDYACVIFNLHTRLTWEEIERNAAVFRQLLDAAIAVDGSYYLTYHRFARPEQTVRCYPRLPAFLAAKRRYDPRGTLDSDWYRYYRRPAGA